MTRRSGRSRRSKADADPLAAVEPTELAAVAEKLPLSRSWRFHLHFRSTAGRYAHSITPFGEAFSTVAGFWRVFNALPQPSASFMPPVQMGVGRQQLKAFSLFEAGIEPTWEDPINAVGGEVFCRCHLSAEAFDGMWETVALACVGGLFDDARVVGVRAVDNSFKGQGETQSKVEVWHEDVSTGETVRERVREILDDGEAPTPELDLQGHEEKSARERSFVSQLKRHPDRRRGR
jgi:hypothetical protein